jgi:SOS-response transcriptional repressor LexA
VHDIQAKILNLLIRKKGVFKDFSFRTLGEILNVEHPQQIKHHVLQLEKRGLVMFDPSSKVLKLVTMGAAKGSAIATIPIVGVANCGQATLFAQENLEGTLKISKKLILNKEKNIFAIRAVGSSMNRANIKGLSIEDGDYVIVDGSLFSPQNGDYVLAVIDEFGIIKRLMKGKRTDEIELVSESTEEHPPIHLHADDQQLIINGHVIYVVKKQRTHWEN